MKLDQLRQWLFELIAIMIPGGFAFGICAHFAMYPASFLSDITQVKACTTILMPFGAGSLDIPYLLSASFAIGHLVNQLSIFCITVYHKVFSVPQSMIIETLFKKRALRDYVLPPQLHRAVNRSKLQNYDYFMMIYPDVAPNTKRETFITVADFSGSMLLVTNLLLIFCATSGALVYLGDQTHIPLTHLATLVVGVLASYLWFRRYLFFRDMADRIVVNYFLGQLGARFSDQNTLVGNDGEDVDE